MSPRALLAVTFIALLAGLATLSSPSPGTAVGTNYVVNRHDEPGVGFQDCGEPQSELCSLRGAIHHANQNAGIDTITFDPAVFTSDNKTATLTHLLLFINATEGITIDGGTNGVDIIPANGFTPNWGLVFISDVGQPAQNINLRNISVRDTNYDGVQICAGYNEFQGTCPGAVSNVSFENVTAVFTDGWGIQVLGSSISGVDFTNVVATLVGPETGIRFEASSGSIVNVSIDGGGASLSGDDGYSFVAGTPALPGNVDGLTMTDTSGGGGGDVGIYISGTVVRNVAIDGHDSDLQDDGVSIRYRESADHISVTGSEFTNDTGIAISIAPALSAGAPVSDVTISGNTATGTNAGIYVAGTDVDDVLIENNVVHPGDGVGIQLYSQPFGSGGTGNMIRGNTVSGHTSGIEVIGLLQATISRNSTFLNDGLGIDLMNNLDPRGVTPNDAGDGDVGPNDFLNYPVFISDTEEELTGTACANCLVEVFYAQPDSSGYGEGEAFIRDGMANGSGAFTISLCQANVAFGTALTATATDGNGNTSEFSAWRYVSQDSSDTCFPPTPTVGPTAVPTPTPTPTTTPSGSQTAPPSGSQTAAPTPTLSTAPTASPNASPTLAPGEYKQGDFDCDGDVDFDDFLFVLMFAAELHDGSNPGGCPDLGDSESDFDWGDANCDGAVDEIDALFLIAHLADADLEPADDNCTAIGASLPA